MASGRRSSRETSAQLALQPHVDWLPPVQSQFLMPSTRVSPFIESQKGSHSFLRFANLLYEEKQDSHQGGMVAKVYAFLHDYIPCGLTGRWSHIHGNDIMDILLCHTRGFSFSRHKATAGAHVAFENLEEWMKKGADWKEAARNSGTERRKGAKRLPVLYTPAALSAILIMSYPETKYWEKVGRLQIDWMLTPEAEVRSGFWKGISKDDFHLFQLEEARSSEVPLLADYNKLFGENFVQAKADIRPFVPSWARDLLSSQTPVTSDAEEESESGGGIEVRRDETDGEEDGHDNAEPERPSDELSELSTHLLYPRPTASTDDLREWLAAQWTSNTHDILQLWCKTWAEKIDKAHHYQEQVITQSLFVESLRRLHSLSNSTTAVSSLAEPFMLLDMEDVKTEARPEDPQATARMRAAAPFQPWFKAVKQLVALARDESRREMLRPVLDGQTSFFCDLPRDKRFNGHFHEAIRLDTLRISVILHNSTVKTPTAAANGNSTRPVDQTDQIHHDTVALLHLTKWQLRMLAVKSLESPNILTDWQNRVYARKMYPDDSKLRDLSQYPPVVAVAYGQEDENPEAREIFCKLLGDISTPFCDLHGDMVVNTEGGSTNSIAINTNGASPTTESSVPPPETPVPPSTNGSHKDTKENSTPGTANSWASLYTRSLGKRASSPDTRTAKAPRLFGPQGKASAAAVEALKTNISAGKEELQAALMTAMISSKDEILDATEERSTWTSEQVAKWLARDHQKLEGKIQSVADTLEAQLERESQQTAVQLRALTGMLEHVQQMVSPHKTGLLPGQEGYITPRCPAPSGWDQKAYESVLLRAGWCYVGQLGFPDDGFEPDDEAWDYTLEKFPTVDGRHLTIMLGHIHCQAYNRPPRELTE